MTSITDILAMEPRYLDNTTTNHEQVDIESRSIVTWQTVAGDQAILDDRHLNAAKAILGKKLAENVTKAINVMKLENYNDYFTRIIDLLEPPLAEWNKLEGENENTR